MARQADASKAVVESVDRGLRIIAEMNKRWDERFSFARPDLLNRYLDGRIHFYLKFRARSAAQRNPVRLYTVLYSPLILHHRRIGAGNRTGKLYSETGTATGAILGDQNGISQNEGMGNDSEKPVFICNVEVVNYLQNRIAWIRNPVWLQSFDQRSKVAGNALYYSVPNGLFEFVRAVTDGEVYDLSVWQPVNAGESPDHVIEARPEMVNDLTGNHGNTQRDWRPDELKNISVTFRLTLSDNGVDATCQKSGDLNIEIVDLLFGPLDLGPASSRGCDIARPKCYTWRDANIIQSNKNGAITRVYCARGGPWHRTCRAQGTRQGD